jgi:cell wall-associated NlpC family hydrolase
MHAVPALDPARPDPPVAPGGGGDTGGRHRDPRPAREPGAALAPVAGGAGPFGGPAGRHLVVGDLVFFADNPGSPGTIHHVGMYIGKGLMVEAPHTGAVVRTSSSWRPSYAGAVRPAP